VDLYRQLGVDKVARAIANGIDKNISIVNNVKEYAIYTVIIINNLTDELAAKYLDRAFGLGILMPHQYKA
jgi:hypothetical protein